MKIAPKTFVVTFPNKTRDRICNVCDYEIKKKILYLKNSNGEDIAVYKKWWCFFIKEE